MYKKTYYPFDLVSETHINPNREGITIKYTVEYTDKDEAIDPEFTNLKRIDCVDLEHSIQTMFTLKQRDKYNIGIYYIVEDQTGWIVEDSCNNTEEFKSNTLEVKQAKTINTLQQEIEAQRQELELYRLFLNKYNASEQFKQFKKEMSSELVAK